MMHHVILSVMSATGLLAAATISNVQPTAQPQERERTRLRMDQPLSEQCKQMAEVRNQVKERLTTSDRKLAELAVKMNSATGEAKSDAMADLLNQLVQERQATHEMMMNMQPQMMEHMMAHMAEASGMSKEQKQALRNSIEQCLANKGMSGNEMMHDRQRPGGQSGG